MELAESVRAAGITGLTVVAGGTPDTITGPSLIIEPGGPWVRRSTACKVRVRWRVVVAVPKGREAQTTLERVAWLVVAALGAAGIEDWGAGQWAGAETITATIDVEQEIRS